MLQYRHVSDTDGSLSRLTTALYRPGSNEARAEQAKAIMCHQPGKERDLLLDLFGLWCKLDTGKPCHLDRGHGDLIELKWRKHAMQVNRLVAA